MPLGVGALVDGERQVALAEQLRRRAEDLESLNVLGRAVSSSLNLTTVLDRVLAFGDAWFPNYGPDDLLARVQELRSRADRHIDVMVMGVPAKAAALEPFVGAGFQRALHWIPSGNRSVVERALDRWEAAIAEVTGEA